VAALTIIDGATVATAFFAACAAGISLWAVLQNRAFIQHQARPELHGQTLVPKRSIVHEAHQNYLALVIHNAGGGMAKQAAYVLASGNQFATQFLGTGFLRPGETAHIETQLLALTSSWGDALGVLICRDLEERTWVWNLAGERRELKRKKGRPFYTAADAWAEFYPQMPLSSMEQVGAAAQVPIIGGTGT
jgi:hypothetical protein